MKFYFGFKYWLTVFLIVILLGLGLSSLISSIVAEIISKEEKMKYKKVFLDLFRVNMPTGFGLALVLCFLFTIKKEYGFNIELLILGSLFISGVISFLETKNVFNLLIGAGSGLGYPVLVLMIKKIIELIKKLQGKKVEEEKGEEMVKIEG